MTEQMWVVALIHLASRTLFEHCLVARHKMCKPCVKVVPTLEAACASGAEEG